MTTPPNQSPLLKQLSYLWRFLATGFAFLLFGCGGILISLAISLFFYLTPIDKGRKSFTARRVISLAFRIYINTLQALGLLTYEIRGKHNIPTSGCLVVANHPSLLDVVFLISQIKQTDCVVKGSLRRNWLTKSPVTAANYVCNDSTGLINDCVAAINTNKPLILFPEGTRTTPGAELNFQRGAANIALMAGCSLLPVSIQCHPATLLKSERWYHIASTPPHYTIEFLSPLNPADMVASDLPQSKAARVLTRHLEQYFTKKLSNRPCP